MRLGRGRPRVALELSPETLLPTQTVTATVTLAESLDGVRDARLELGYVNTYVYRWAGRRDAALRSDDSSWATMGQVGTDAGSERTTTDWVAVLDEPIALATGELAAGTHEVALRIPSWAPGSSSIVQWEVRLRIDRDGRDVALERELRVLAPAPAQPPEPLALEHVEGGSSTIVVDTERSSYRAGERIVGTVTLTPNGTVPEADVAVFLVRARESHPLQRTPGSRDVLRGDRVQLDKHLALTNGEPATLAFEIDVPADTDPTCEAVHSSLTWFVETRVFYKGFSHGLERVRREVLLGTA